MSAKENAAKGSATTPTMLGRIADAWLSKVVPTLLQTASSSASAPELVRQSLAALDGHSFTRTLLALLELHHSQTADPMDGEPGSPVASVGGATASTSPSAANPPSGLGALYGCIAHALSASMVSPRVLAEYMPIWKLTTPTVSPPNALAGTASHLSKTVFSPASTERYLERRLQTEVDAAQMARDSANERLVGPPRHES